MIFNIKNIRDISKYNYIGRHGDSLLGNPFIIGRDGSRAEVIEKYEKYALSTPNVLQGIADLDDRPLLCHCSPKPCHGEVIIKLKELIKKGDLKIPTSHRLAIVGSRSFTDYELFKKYLEKCIEVNNIQYHVIISGGAKGTDSLAEKYAEEKKIPLEVYEADWDNLGKKAGFIRNSLLVEKSTYMIAFWDEISPGTIDSISKSKKFNRKTITIYTKRLK